MLGRLFGKLTEDARCFLFRGFRESLLLIREPGRSERARDFELVGEEWSEPSECVGSTSLSDSLLCSRILLRSSPCRSCEEAFPGDATGTGTAPSSGEPGASASSSSSVACWAEISGCSALSCLIALTRFSASRFLTGLVKTVSASEFASSSPSPPVVLGGSPFVGGGGASGSSLSSSSSIERLGLPFDAFVGSAESGPGLW